MNVNTFDTSVYIRLRMTFHYSIKYSRTSTSDMLPKITQGFNNGPKNKRFELPY